MLDSEIEVKSNLARKLKATVQNQELLMRVLGEAYQHLWNDEDMRTKCDEAIREVSREAVRTARQWLDLADSIDRSRRREQERSEEEESPDLPF